MKLAREGRLEKRWKAYDDILKHFHYIHLQFITNSVLSALLFKYSFLS